MTAGRPTKYNKELQKKADYYAKNYEDFGHVVPSVSGLSRVLNISLSTIKDWAHHKNKTEFSATLEKIAAEQELVTLNKGLTGEFKSPIAKLLLNNHGYSEKVQNDQSGEIDIRVTYEE